MPGPYAEEENPVDVVGQDCEGVETDLEVSRNLVPALLDPACERRDGKQRRASVRTDGEEVGTWRCVVESLETEATSAHVSS